MVTVVGGEGGPTDGPVVARFLDLVHRSGAQPHRRPAALRDLRYPPFTMRGTGDLPPEVTSRCGGTG